MRVLCTNDDGIWAPGIPVLAERLLGGDTDVVVAAPEHDMSGSGTSILVPGSTDRAIRIRPHVFEDHPELTAMGVTGTPAMTVLLAHRGVFGDIPDAVVSGPNFGANTGHDVHHSGTVGAALTAARLGMHGIAVSLAFGVGAEVTETGTPGPHWETAAFLARTVLKAITDVAPRRPVFLNVNVPDRAVANLAGVRTVSLAKGSPYRIEGFDESTDDDGVRVLRATVVVDGDGHGSETDIGALRDGAAAISWLTLPGDGEPEISDLHEIVADVGELITHG